MLRQHCKQTHVYWVKTSGLQLEGTLSHVMRFDQARHIVPNAFLVKMWRFRKGLYMYMNKTVEGQNKIPIVLSMITVSYVWRRRVNYFRARDEILRASII